MSDKLDDLEVMAGEMARNLRKALWVNDRQYEADDELRVAKMLLARLQAAHAAGAAEELARVVAVIDERVGTVRRGAVVIGRTTDDYYMSQLLALLELRKKLVSP